MRETLSEILLTLRLILDTVITGAADAAEVLAFVRGENRTDLEIYRIGLSRLAIAAALLPIPILLLGIFGFSMWISIAGLIWAFFTILLSLLAAPIALIIDAVWHRTTVGLGERYVRLTLHVIFAELSFAMMLIVIPIEKRPELIPLLLLLALIIFIGTRLFGGAFIFNGRAITVVASMIFIAIVISLFLPRTTALARTAARGIDNNVVAVFSLNSPTKPTEIGTNQKILVGMEFPIKPGEDNYLFATSVKGKRTEYKLEANQPIIIRSAQPDGSLRDFRLGPGRFGWEVLRDQQAGQLRVRSEQPAVLRIIDVNES